MNAKSYRPGPAENTVCDAGGRIVAVPDGWSLLPPGDAALTRRVKAAGEHLLVQERRGRRVFSRGIWAPTLVIEQIRRELQSERSTTAYQKRREANSRRRDKLQSEYVEDFCGAVVAYLDFHSNHKLLAVRIARVVADHATPIGSGTVARTRRIPVEQRAEAAVIAWLRHHTTDYDSMAIPRVTGKRRQIRRRLAQRSKELLNRYRTGEPIGANCLLRLALDQSDEQGRRS